jgi:hypothetical protein
MKALDESIYRSTTLSADICPEDCIAEPAIAVQVGDDLCQSYIRKFWSLSPRTVEPKLCLNRGQVFLGLSFVTLCRRYQDVFTSFALEWSPDDFIFRELAFAIISIASGQVRFHSFPRRDCDPKRCLRWNCPNGHTLSKGRLVIPDGGLGVGGSNILPEFGYGCHQPDDAPGSAPMETISPIWAIRLKQSSKPCRQDSSLISIWEGNSLVYQLSSPSLAPQSRYPNPFLTFHQKPMKSCMNHCSHKSKNSDMQQKFAESYNTPSFLNGPDRAYRSTE